MFLSYSKEYQSIGTHSTKSQAFDHWNLFVFRTKLRSFVGMAFRKACQQINWKRHQLILSQSYCCEYENKAMCIHCECRTIQLDSRFSSNRSERIKCRVKIAPNGIATQKCLFNSILFYFISKLKFALPLLRWVCAFSAFCQHKSPQSMTT